MKIILSATTSWNLFNSRMGLARALKASGNEVIFLSPHDKYSQYLIDKGFSWVHFPLKPRGKNIFQELASMLFMISFYRRVKPDLVYHFTPKGVIYGSLVAKIAGVKVIFNTITGLGYVFSEPSERVLRTLVKIFYPIALFNTIAVFQNSDDQKLFCEKRIVASDKNFLIRSSGVDMDLFKFSPQVEGKPIVLLSSRFVKEKGIRYFIEAARILKTRNINVRLALVGQPEENQPTSITLTEIEKGVSGGLVDWWGWHDNMEEIYPKAHVVCLPTYYMEGVPKVLIEAAACGRPLIATNVPGCREIVQNGYNGILVPPKNALALADAITKLSKDREMRKRMGRNSRELASINFSAEKVIADYFELYEKYRI